MLCRSSFAKASADRLFLEDYYFKNISDDLGSILGDIQLFPEGGTYDPAMWGEWLEGVGDKQTLTEEEALDAMKKFLEVYLKYVDSEDIRNLINSLSDPDIHLMWQEAVNKAKDMK